MERAASDNSGGACHDGAVNTLHALAAAAFVACATALAFALKPLVGPSDLAMIFVAAIVVTAFLFGRWPSMLASALSVAAYDFFFVPPYFTFAVSDTHHLVTFAMMFVLGILIAELTDRARKNELAARAAVVRAQTEEVRSSLLSAVSHDLRTPLATITGAASTLRDDGSRLGETERRELAGAVCDEAERMERLVRNLLDMTKLEGGGVRLQTDWVPLDEVVGSALTRVERTLAHRPITTAIDPKLGLLRVDPVLLEQLFVNLFENAAKHTPDASPIEVRAAEATEGDRKVVEIVVGDRGPGFRDGELETVFEKFARGGRAGGSGAGLGLAIVRGVARAHGGTALARNRKGGGAEIVVRLPEVAGAPAAPEEAA